jgi:hypothetical protein
LRSIGAGSAAIMPLDGRFEFAITYRSRGERIFENERSKGRAIVYNYQAPRRLGIIRIFSRLYFAAGLLLPCAQAL